jgi:SNF family Na+-dependent transporter
VARLAAVAAAVAMLAGIVGGIGRIGTLFIPALIVLVIGGLRLWLPESR